MPKPWIVTNAEIGRRRKKQYHRTFIDGRERPMLPIHHTVGRFDASIVRLVIYKFFVHALAQFQYIWSQQLEVVHEICMYNLRALFYFWLCGIAACCFVSFCTLTFCCYCCIEYSAFFQLFSSFEITLSHLCSRGKCMLSDWLFPFRLFVCVRLFTFT